MDKKAEIQMIQEYLSNLYNCQESDLDNETILFTVNNASEEPYIKIAAYKRCVVVCTSVDMQTEIEEVLSDKTRDEIFECPLVYGQTIHYVPNVNYMKELELPEEYTYELLEGADINRLVSVQGFDNSLVFDEDGKTATQLVFVAKKDSEVSGMAGAGVVTDKIWEVGIDVKPEFRNCGLGSALVKKLTLEILKRDIVPFYSASVTNIASQMVASRAGYIPCWVDTFGNVFDSNYAYDYEEVVKTSRR